MSVIFSKFFSKTLTVVTPLPHLLSYRIYTLITFTLLSSQLSYSLGSLIVLALATNYFRRSHTIREKTRIASTSTFSSKSKAVVCWADAISVTDLM